MPEAELLFSEASRYLKPDDIAQKLGVSTDNFYVIKQRILKKLKDIAEKKDVYNEFSHYFEKV